MKNAILEEVAFVWELQAEDASTTAQRAAALREAADTLRMLVQLFPDVPPAPVKPVKPQPGWRGEIEVRRPKDSLLPLSEMHDTWWRQLAAQALCYGGSTAYNEASVPAWVIQAMEHAYTRGVLIERGYAIKE